MNKSDKKLQSGSSRKVLIVLSILLVLIAGMVIDPYAGLICFALAGMISLIAVLSSTGWTRRIALILLIVIIILTVLKFPQARDHYRAYRDKSVTGDIK